MLRIINGPLNVIGISSAWKSMLANEGALCLFEGIVRDDVSKGGAIDAFRGLSFDIFAPLLTSWFKKYQLKAQQQKVTIFLAHSTGDVLIKETSFIFACASLHRKESLSFYSYFIEEFKTSAPIWKYDLIGNNRIYAQSRSHKLDGAGILTFKKTTAIPIIITTPLILEDNGMNNK